MTGIIKHKTRAFVQ